MPRFTVNNLLGGDTRKISSGASPFDLERMKRLLETIRESTIGKPVDESFYQGIPGQEEYGGVPSIRGPRWHDPEYLAQQGMFLMQPVAYHGTPHTFERFSTEKIGTGEGAQAYGHGLYFAERPGVAKSYSGGENFDVLIGGRKIVPSPGSGEREAAWFIGKNIKAGRGADSFQLARYQVKDAFGVGSEESNKIINIIDKFEKSGATFEGSGNLYKVNIKPPAEKFLDWDKPLSEQPRMLEIAKLYFGEQGQPERWTGKDLYDVLSGLHGTSSPGNLVWADKRAQREASELLNKYGIPGIKYLDQASRGRASLDVLKKNLNIEENVLKDWESARVKNMYPEDLYKEKVSSIKKSIEHYKKVIKETEKNPPTYNYVVFSDKDVSIMHPREKFWEVANLQRGKPEQAMLKAQEVMGGGVMQPAVEHIGDLTHRMSEKIMDDTAGYEFVHNKVNRMINYLEHEYGFNREFIENLENNAKYAREYKGSKLSNYEYMQRAFKYLDEYSKAHSELPAYNEAQRLARDAAVALGKRDFNTTLNNLYKLREHLGSKDEWVKFARENIE